MPGPSLFSPKSLFRQRGNVNGLASPESTSIGELLSFLVGTAATFVGVKSHGAATNSCKVAPTTAFPKRSLPLKRGQRLGPFQLLRRLGQGAQGDVWKALQLTPSIRMVALKVMNSGLRENPVRLAQFRREAARGAKLVGPSLLPICDAGQIDGYFFMSMPYVEGISLKEIITARTLYEEGDSPKVSHPVITADDEIYIGFMVQALAKASRALAQVHQNRVVHRDIKPANILLDLNRTDRVYLCDFGLGRELDVATSEQLRDGSGTPMFMAPERLLRDPADEVKCDIYSMGVTLYEALTLKRPFRIPENSSWPMIATFLATTDPLPPSRAMIGLPQQLEAIILRAMSRDPSKRHSSATELADELNAFQAYRSPHYPKRRAHSAHKPSQPHFTHFTEAT